MKWAIKVWISVGGGKKLMLGEGVMCCGKQEAP
jgi:hypothetical protein